MTTLVVGVPETRKINGYTLDKDINFTAADIGGLGSAGGNVTGDLKIEGLTTFKKTGMAAQFGSDADGNTSTSNTIVPNIGDYISIKTAQNTAGSTGIMFHNTGVSTGALYYKNTDANTGAFHLVSDDTSYSFRFGNNFTVTNSGSVQTKGEVQTEASSSFRLINGNYGTFWRNDGSSLYLMLTNYGDPSGGFSALRPFTVNLSTGGVQLATTTVNGTLSATEVYDSGKRVYSDVNKPVPASIGAVDLVSDQTIAGHKTFTGYVDLGSGIATYEAVPVAANQVANKLYVDFAVNQALGTIDVSRLVTTNTVQTITGAKTFNANLSVSSAAANFAAATSVNVPTPQVRNNAANKEYVDDTISESIKAHEQAAGVHGINSVTGLQSALDGKYSKSNILGTVSQSAGVPTGAIIERGSNANGEYTKFADGTMICTHGGTLYPGNFNAYGTIFQVPQSWVFPVQYTSAPVVSAPSARRGTGAIWSVATNSYSTGVDFRFFDINSANAANPEVIFRISAIGRWY